MLSQLLLVFETIDGCALANAFTKMPLFMQNAGQSAAIIWAFRFWAMILIPVYEMVYIAQINGAKSLL